MASDVPKKILWIFLFLILAAIAVLGVLFIRGYQSNKQVTAVVDSPTPEAEEVSDEEVALTISTPEADVATTSARFAFAGKTTPEALVAITGGAEDTIVSANSDGTFLASVALAEGLNAITFQTFTEAGESTSVKRNVVYTKGAL